MSRASSQEIALRAEGLWFAYRETDWILKDVCLSIPSGQITIIMGPSGTGKTTLLKILAGILTPSRGQVEVFNHNIANQPQRSIASLIGYIPQQLGLVRNLTALENVLMGALGRCGNGSALLGLFPREEVKKAEAALDLMGIAHKTNEKVFRLSGGERQRVAIARTLLQHPRVVVADEFVSDLDMALALEILSRIRRRRGTGTDHLCNEHASAGARPRVRRERRDASGGSYRSRVYPGGVAGIGRRRDASMKTNLLITALHRPALRHRPE